MKTPLKLLPLLGILLISGCQMISTSSGNATEPAADIISSPTPLPTNMTDLTEEPDPQAQKMIKLATEHLARKLKIREDQIFLFSVLPMTWPDSSLGCPRSGIVYEKVETPGYQILFDAAGQSATYHTDTISKVILCKLRPPDDIFLPP